MFIPQGNWIVVRRPVRGASHERGEIVKASLTENAARNYATAIRAYPSKSGFDFWAMDRKDY